MSNKKENKYKKISKTIFDNHIETIKSELKELTLIEQESQSWNVKIFLIQEMGTILEVIDDRTEVMYRYKNKSFDSEIMSKMINNFIKRDYEIHCIKKSNKYKNFIKKIEAIINQEVPNDLYSQVNIKLKNKEILSFSISDLRRFIIDDGNSDAQTDYFSYIHLKSQKEMFEYLEEIYQKGGK